jgi:Arc/MetJ-type ribon-helix-helix transcriptional regulator
LQVVVLHGYWVGLSRQEFELLAQATKAESESAKIREAVTQFLASRAAPVSRLAALTAPEMRLLEAITEAQDPRAIEAAVHQFLAQRLAATAAPRARGAPA